jgi:hypothetical protein
MISMTSDMNKGILLAFDAFLYLLLSIKNMNKDYPTFIEEYL